MRFNQTIKNLNRIRQIIQVLVKYGFEDVVTSTTLKNLVPRGRRLAWSRGDRSVFEFSRWERIRMVAEELGPTAIKFAQVLSNRPDVLPEALIRQFEKLQSEVPPMPFSDIRRIIEEELGQPISEVFEAVEEKALGSASIGQVHRAVLRLEDGSTEDVVIKVQRPKARKIIETDLSILREVIARTDSYLQRQGLTNVMDVVDALEHSMQRELDYRNEMRNIRQFRAFYHGRQDFRIPKAYSHINTERILVTEFAEGCRISDKSQLLAWGLDPEEIARRGMHIYLAQIFEFGYFHADPHPGNVIINSKGIIQLIDFGMIGRLNKIDKFSFAGIFIGMAQKNARKMAQNLSRLATEHDIEDHKRLERDCAALIDDFADLDLEESNIAELGTRLQKIIYDYRLKVPGGVFLILRALAILEGIGKQLSPGMNAYEEVKPYGIKLMREQYSFQNIMEEVTWRISSFDQLLRSFPVEVAEILKTVRKGKLHIETESVHHEETMQRVERTGDRIVLALLVAGLAIAGAISMWAPTGPLSPTTMTLFIAAALVTLVLLVRSLRN